jgi:hypothetical protein
MEGCRDSGDQRYGTVRSGARRGRADGTGRDRIRAGPSHLVGLRCHRGGRERQSCARPGYNTVQVAVTAAAAGSTVKVCAGTYTEQVEITKSLTLTGTGGKATLTLPASPANSVACASTASSQYGVDVCGPIHVTLSNLVIDSAWPSGTCNDDLDAVLVAGGATLEFSNSAVTAAGAVPINGCQGGIGVLVTSGHLKMSDSAISGYQKNGITIKGTGSTATIAGVKVTGAGPTPAIAQNGIEVAEGAWASITGSTVRGNECDVSVCGPDSLSQTQSTGVLFFAAAPGSVFSHSTASGNDIGVYFPAASDSQTGAWIGHDSVVNNRYEDICLDQGKAEIDSTQIRGGNQPNGAQHGGPGLRARPAVHRRAGKRLAGGSARIASCRTAPAASRRSSLPAGPISWTLAGVGPPAGTGSASAGNPARFTGEVRPRIRARPRASPRAGGKPSRVGRASRST